MAQVMVREHRELDAMEAECDARLLDLLVRAFEVETARADELVSRYRDATKSAADDGRLLALHADPFDLCVDLLGLRGEDPDFERIDRALRLREKLAG